MTNIHESGRSMVEMLGVLAIIGVLSVGGIAGYSKAMNKYKINKTTDQVSMLVANIRTLFSTQGNYDDLSNTNAINFGVVPEDMISTASSGTKSLKNAFNGDVTIEKNHARSTKKGNTDPFDAFTITYEGLSQEACVTIATGDWGSGQASGLIGIAAGKTGVKAGVEETYVDTSGDSVSSSGSGDSTASGGLVVGIPGGANVSTPIPVTEAVNACIGGGSGNAVAWKYY